MFKVVPSCGGGKKFPNCLNNSRQRNDGATGKSPFDPHNSEATDEYF